MFAKIVNGTVVTFPYTVGDLRRDYPNVSFPKNIPVLTMKNFNMHPVHQGPYPDSIGEYQVAKLNDLPTLVNDRWQIDYSVVDMFEDTEDSEGNVVTKATREQEYQQGLDDQAAEENRIKRDQLLAETDYLALSDNTMSAGMTTYRQALRDITSHADWPHLEEDDWPTKP